jgi:hypothetical protein
MLSFISFILNPNNTIVSLLVVLTILTLIALLLPSGSTYSIEGNTNSFYSITKSYCLFVSMVPLL